MKRIAAIILALALVAGLGAPPSAPLPVHPEQAHAAVRETRAMWFAFCDFKALGLKDKSKAAFEHNLGAALDKAKSYGVNTVYFHVRAFDDAAWKSKTFKASKYLTSKSSAGKTAYRTYSFDPLSSVVALCRKRGMRIEAWLNPYRITYGSFLDPASSRSTKRIKRAVKELKAYKLNGIHFDDYFYHSTGKYIAPTKATVYKPAVKGKKSKGARKGAARRAYVNKMVKAVYKSVHAKKKWTLGISPSGNIANCMSAGADVKTWLSAQGYVDYVAPQIYWTDSNREGKLFTARLKQWSQLNKRGVKLYVGLALYRAGNKSKGDPGFAASNNVMRNQVIQLRKAGYKGFALFASADLYRAKAVKQLERLKSAL